MGRVSGGIRKGYRGSCWSAPLCHDRPSTASTNRYKYMKTMAKQFKKSGFEGIWRAESKTLDVFEVHIDADTGRDVPYLLKSKQFTNGRVAESYFRDKVW